MESEDNPLVGLLVILVILGFIIQAILFILQLVLQAMAVLVIVGAVLTFCLGLGLCANLTVRFLIGVWGDQGGDKTEVIERRARLGFVMMLTAPLPVLTLLLLLGGSAELALSGLVWFIVTPAYYATWWVEDIRYQDRKWILRIELPFKTDAAMRAEERILYAQFVTFLSTVALQSQLFFLTLLGGRK